MFGSYTGMYLGIKGPIRFFQRYELLTLKLGHILAILQSLIMVISQYTWILILLESESCISRCDALVYMILSVDDIFLDAKLLVDNWVLCGFIKVRIDIFRVWSKITLWHFYYLISRD